MQDEDSLDELARAIAAANPGLSPDLADEYAARIGDTPETVPGSDLVIVRGDDREEIARIHVPLNDSL